MSGYRVPFADAETEFTEKRSRFITNLWRVETEAEARAKIEEIRKRHYDARHHCWCYLLREGGAVRYSDDGEPQGTAGQPMLNVFQRENVTNVVCVVTRYFGGILLGAGGLVFLLLGRFRHGMNLNDCLCRATLCRNGKRLEVGALVDSGNSLVEPISKKPVCVLDRGAFEMLWEGEDGTFRAIPYRSIGKKRGIMPGYLLSGLELEVEGMSLYFKDVYVAVSGEEISAGEGVDAESVKMIVNPGLLTGSRKGKPLGRRDEGKDDSENSVTGQDAV